jgi:CheY-like chemotaxis protein
MNAKPLIVIVDDEEADRMLLKIAMDDISFKARVVEYENGTQFLAFAREKCGKTPPDFVILDIEMPQTNGIEVLEYLEEHPGMCSVPIIIFTTSCDEKKIDSTRKLGAIKCVSKPSNLKGYTDLAKFMKKSLERLAGVDK